MTNLTVCIEGMRNFGSKIRQLFPNRNKLYYHGMNKRQIRRQIRQYIRHYKMWEKEFDERSTT